jgi:hypothetical protein
VSDAFLARVEDGLRDTWDDMIAAMLAALVDKAPASGLFDADEVKRTVEQVAFHLVGTAVGSAVEPRRRAFVRAHAAKQARDGVVSLEGLGAAFQEMIDAGYLHVLHLTRLVGVRTAEEQEAVDASALRVMRMASDVQRELADAFAEARAEQHQLADDARPAVEFVERVLAAGGDEWPALRREAEELGFGGPTLDEWAVLAVTGRRGVDAGRLREAASKMVAAIDGALEGPTRYEPAPHVVVLVGGELSNGWAAAVAEAGAIGTETGVLVAASRAPRRLVEVPALHERITRNLAYATVRPRTGLLDLGELQFYRLLADPSPLERVSMAQLVLGPLLRPVANHDLLCTLDALVEHGSQKASATARGMGEKAVGRRVADIAERTGYDWNDPLHRRLLSTAVACRWLAAVAPRGYDRAVWGPISESTPCDQPPTS